MYIAGQLARTTLCRSYRLLPSHSDPKKINLANSTTAKSQISPKSHLGFRQA